MWIYLPKNVLEKLSIQFLTQYVSLCMNDYYAIFGHVNRHCLRQCVNVLCETYDEHHRVKTWSKNNTAMNDITIPMYHRVKSYSEQRIKR